MIEQAVWEPTSLDWPTGAGELDRFAGKSFDQLPDGAMRAAYGERYVELRDATGGQMWINRHGWKHVTQLDPSCWYAGEAYYHRGVRLSNGSGAVYRVPGRAVHGRAIDLVVKFSRMAQQVQLDVSSTFPGGVRRHELDETLFNDPFQEFALLEELRTSDFGPAALRILTKRPLAIYSPARRFAPGQLGRSSDLYQQLQSQLHCGGTQHDAGAAPIDLSIDRQYILLFHWVRGLDADQAVRRGLLTGGEAERLVRRVVGELAAKGFRVLDTKPNHVILRSRRDQGLLRRDGELAYALVDFELLQRTAEYARWLQSRDH